MASGEPWQMMRPSLTMYPRSQDPERISDVVVGHEHPDPSLAQLADESVDLGHGDRIDAGEGLVQQHEAGGRGKRPRDLDAAPFAPGQVLTAYRAQVLQPERPHELQADGPRRPASRSRRSSRTARRFCSTVSFRKTEGSWGR